MNIGIDGRILEWKYSGIARYVNLLLSFDFLKGATIYFPGKTNVTVDEKYKKKVLANPFRRRELYEQIILPYTLAKDKIDLFIQPYNFGIPIAYFKKSILIIFDIIPLLFKDYFFFARHKKWAKWNYEVNTKIALRKATKIVADSESARRDILKYFPRMQSDKVEPIYYGFERSDMSENVDFLKLKKSKGIFDEYILAPAGLEERKNAHLLISAYAEFLNQSGKKIQLVFTGYNKFYLDKLRILSTSLKLENKVIFVDYVSEFEKNALIKNSKLVINPSQFEGFGIPLLEAAEHGKSIICSDTPVFKEVGGSYPIYFKNNSEEDLAKKITYFFENQSEENFRASSQAENLLKRFPVSEVEDKWKKLIKSIYD